MPSSAGGEADAVHSESGTVGLVRTQHGRERLRPRLLEERRDERPRAGAGVDPARRREHVHHPDHGVEGGEALRPRVLHAAGNERLARGPRPILSSR